MSMESLMKSQNGALVEVWETSIMWTGCEAQNIIESDFMVEVFRS